MDEFVDLPPRAPHSPDPIQASAPVVPVYIPQKPKFSIMPLIFGFLLVIILAAVVGVVYYKNKLVVSSPDTVLPTIAPSLSPLPSVSPSAVASSSPKVSVKPTSKPVSSPKSLIAAAPSVAPVLVPFLDLRFGNPSVGIKQTIDEGKGDGRVINREYSSIQSGQFDEVSSSWSPRVTTCFHFVSNEEIAGKDLKYTFSLDDKVESEGNLAQYDKLEVGRLYDWCRDVTTGIGQHTAKLLINPDKSLKELNYTNDLAKLAWENLPDRIAPNLTFGGPYNWDDKGTCFVVYPPSDNLNTLAELKVEQKVDTQSWTPIVDGMYCFKGVSGSTHTYSVHAIDARGNVNEQSRSFNLF